MPAHRIPGEIRGMRTAAALYQAVVLWILYIAIEPYFRRVWPHQLTSWIRFLDGKWRDPLVGRDLLVSALGAVWVLVVMAVITRLEGGENSLSMRSSPHAFWGSPFTALLHKARDITLVTLSMLSVIMVLHAVTRLRWLSAASISVLIFLLIGVDEGSHLRALVPAVGIFLMISRFGVLAYIVGPVLANFLDATPLGTDFGRWYAVHTLPALAAVVAVGGWGAYVAAAGPRDPRARAYCPVSVSTP